MFNKIPAANNLEWLQRYYLSLCNDDWEHGYGFKIENLDNPGWTFALDLTDTPMAGISFEAQIMERSEHDWFHCRLEGKSFHAYCGPLNLDEVISIFRGWVEANEVKVFKASCIFSSPFLEWGGGPRSGGGAQLRPQPRPSVTDACGAVPPPHRKR